MLVKIFFTFLAIKCSLAFFSTHEEPEIVISDDYKSSAVLNNVKEKWISQKLDNFNESDSRVWNMRYYENDGYFSEGGPIFIYVGGEWTISDRWLTTGHMHDMTKEFRGIMFYTEHRYYGKSRPVSDTSTENLKYLTVQQAMADLAHFIRDVKMRNSTLENSGVILVGASYSASVVTWMRLKYPDLVNGAWASSAPLYAKVDFYEYNELMTESIRLSGGTKCLERLENAFKKLEFYLASPVEPQSIAKIKSDFNLCEPLEPCRDTSHFFYEMSDTVAGLVQKHQYDDIQKACEFMTQEKFGSDDVEAFGAWIAAKKKVKCVDMNYGKLVERFTNVSWDSEANRQLRQWIYQTCDAFGWFQSGTSLKQAFGSRHPQLSYFIIMCEDFYGNRFNQQNVEQNVDRTNNEFGGFYPQVTNVYSTHGYLDPWRAMGAQSNLSENSPTVALQSYSHCSDLNSISSRDTVEMKESKLRIRDLVKGWLKLK